MDVSSFLLFEAMGDSEEDCDIHRHPIVGDDQGDIAAAMAIMADDDAESCSYDSFDSPRVDDLDDCDDLDLLQASVNDDDDDDDDDDDGHDDDDDDDDDDDEEEGHSYPTWAVEHNWKLGAGRRKSGVSVDSSDEFMDEAEKNRLFWEACLAS
ncbi:hypothetical protein FH972_006051 [Carpinus fangiana]|uniref:Uncharacterized protein n=1 Tax=Carpinus fangiana TaxID=176857 RepID=A0A5N6QU20_9ROSI|nr:hypothetical protein FH972_006051 [Carpinus fangiana]